MKIYSLGTGETLRLMGGHADVVTGVQLNPRNHMQVGGDGLSGVPGCPCPRPRAGWRVLENELEVTLAFWS